MAIVDDLIHEIDQTVVQHYDDMLVMLEEVCEVLAKHVPKDAVVGSAWDAMTVFTTDECSKVLKARRRFVDRFMKDGV